MSGRIGLAALGVVMAGYGGLQLWSNQRIDQLASVALWLAGGVAAHDALIAPAAIALGWLFTRTIPGWGRGAAVVGGIVLGALSLVAVPVLGAWGRRPDNASLLPRDYWSGWLLLLALIVVGCGLSALVIRRSAARLAPTATAQRKPGDSSE